MYSCQLLAVTAADGTRPLFHRLVTVIGGGLLMLTTLVALSPALLSTSLGLRAAMAAVNTFTPTHVTVAEASLGWRRPVLLRGMAVAEPKQAGGAALLQAEALRTTEPLWAVVAGREFDAVLAAPRVSGERTANGDWRLEGLLQAWESAQQRAQRPARLAPAAVPAAPAELAMEPAAPAEVRFSADVVLGNAHVFMADGIVHSLQPALREVLGQDVHVAWVVGQRGLQDKGADMGLAADWLRSESPPADLKGLVEPFACSLNSEHVRAEGSGWRSPAGLRLRQPATASLDYTPALARHGLARVNPLLTDIAAVEGGTLDVTVAPERLQLPSERLIVRMVPARLRVGRGVLLGRALELVPGGGGKRAALEVQTAATEFVLVQGGAVVTRRLDLLVGSASRGVHLAIWGEVDPPSGRVNMMLGLPARTLAAAGLRVPPGYMLPLAVRGTLTRPQVDWVGAYQQLAALAMQQRAGVDAEAVAAAAPAPLRDLVASGHRQSAERQQDSK
ncbi:hypothetical protein WJX81_006881 [Elliptochloris bilobata]|uniref:AsmA-like C-terminal domain-containing protein n=1 Tax=Elliptochloris bilobata TaxID=381761 RepID=A0AAW1RX56_9CHLO